MVLQRACNTLQHVSCFYNGLRPGVGWSAQHGWNTLSTEVTPETSRQAYAEKGVARLDSLGPWYGVTVAYLAISALLVFVRRSEFGFGCEVSDPKCGSLQLNDIGDVAAGIFAPLAFLWLFVATQLQRRELSLQRAELAETRAVLADQQRELEISAKESAHQTEIMRRTLESTMSRSVYDDFNLQLYFIAKIWTKTHGKGIFYEGPDENNTGQIWFMNISDVGSPVQEQPSTIDNFYDTFYKAMDRLVVRIANGQKLKIAGRGGYIIWRAFQEGIEPMEVLLENSIKHRNNLVLTRSEGLSLHLLLQDLKHLHAHIKENSIEEINNYYPDPVPSV